MADGQREGSDHEPGGPGAEPGATGARVAAFFDLDKTVIKQPAMVAFARPLYDAGFITKRLLVRAAYNRVRFRGVRGPDAARMAKFRETGLRIVKGRNAEEVRTIVRRTLPDRIEPTVFPDALATIREHQRSGHLVWIVSAEPEEIVVPLAEHLGIDGVISSQAVIGPDGCYTGESRSWIYGPEKAAAIRDTADRLGLDLAECFAYSDSATDEPMLSAVGHPIAVNPDRALRRIATRRSWAVRQFSLDGSTPSNSPDERLAVAST